MNKLMILTLIAIILLGPMKVAQKEGCKLFKLRAEATNDFVINSRYKKSNSKNTKSRIKNKQRLKDKESRK